jgi:hypothetical protein
MIKNKKRSRAMSCLVAVFLLFVSFLSFIKFVLPETLSVPIGNRYAVVYYGYISPDLANLFIERNYSLIIASSETPIPNTLKKSGIKVYAYLDILGLPIEQLGWVLKNHSNWVLYKEDGHVATYWYNTDFICNIAEKSFQDYLISKAKNILSRGFDGLFLDDVVLNISDFNVIYDKSVYGSWSNALLVFFERLKNETGTSIIYNAGWAYPAPELMRVADGVMLESHPGSWAGNVNHPTYYYRDWDEVYPISLRAQKFAEEGKIVIALSYGNNLEAEEYTYAVTRLFDFYYWYSTPDLGKISDSKVLNLNLGTPLSAYNEKNGVYYRLYENGVVVVMVKPILKEAGNVNSNMLHLHDCDYNGSIVVSRSFNQPIKVGQSFIVKWDAFISNYSDLHNVGVAIQEVAISINNTYQWCSFYYYGENVVNAGGHYITEDMSVSHNYKIVLNRTSDELSIFYYIDNNLVSTSTIKVSPNEVSTISNVDAGRSEVSNTYDLYLYNIQVIDTNNKTITEDFKRNFDSFFIDHTKSGNVSYNVAFYVVPKNYLFAYNTTVELNVPESWRELYSLDGKLVKVENGKITLNIEANKGIVLMLNEVKTTNFLTSLIPSVLPFVFVAVASIIILLIVALNKKLS